MSSLPRHHGKNWPSEEEEILCYENRSAMSIKEIAKIHQRTPNAIRLRLLHIAERFMEENRPKEEIAIITGLSMSVIDGIKNKNKKILDDILERLQRVENQLKNKNIISYSWL